MHFSFILPYKSERERMLEFYEWLKLTPFSRTWWRCWMSDEPKNMKLNAILVIKDCLLPFEYAFMVGNFTLFLFSLAYTMYEVINLIQWWSELLSDPICNTLSIHIDTLFAITTDHCVFNVIYVSDVNFSMKFKLIR